MKRQKPTTKYSFNNAELASEEAEFWPQNLPY